MHPDDIRRIGEALASRPGRGQFGRSVIALDRVVSTNLEAADRARAGAPHGTVILADVQTAGRGRLGRSWESEPGESLLVSVILRPESPVDTWSWIPLAAALAVCDAVRQRCPSVGVGIKWPNDVMAAMPGDVGRHERFLPRLRKIAGILVESRLEANEPGSAGQVVVGIGLNVNQERFPGHLAATAASLRMVYGRRLERAPLLSDLVDRLDVRMTSQAADPAGMATDFRDCLLGVGDPVSVRLTDSDDPTTGILSGVDAAGALVLDTDTGIRTFTAGECTLHRS